MKALSLWQPYATLIALSAKTHETRSWATTYTGLLAIHAAKNKATLNLFHDYTFRMALAAAGYKSPDDLPLGCIVAIVDLADCQPTQTVLARGGISAQERAFGDWTPGRWAWKLENIRRLQEPIPISGKQGLWSWDVAGYLRTMPADHPDRAMLLGVA